MIRGHVRLPARVREFPGRVRDVASFTAFAARRFMADNCAEVASALTYTSLLALVPLLTIGFAVFTAFPAFQSLQQQAQELLFEFLVPQVGETVRENIDQFMHNAGQLTAFGVVGLTFTSILLLSTIEASFNRIWRATETRPWTMRLLAFWAILTVTPILFGLSLSISGSLYATLREFGLAGTRSPVAALGVLLPLVVEGIGFSFLYLLIPNRTVRWQDAATGGAAAAVMFEIAKSAFGWYLAEFPAYQTIYGALSAIPTFLVWLYISWSTVLVGAVIAAGLPEWRAGKITRIGPEGMLPSQRLSVALAILHELQHASRLGVGIRRRTLIGRVPIGAAVVDAMLEQLREAHWVVRASNRAWVLSRDLGEATLYDLEKSLGIGLRGVVRGIEALDSPWQRRAFALLQASDESHRGILSVPLKEILADEPGPGEARGPAAGRVAEVRARTRSTGS